MPSTWKRAIENSLRIEGLWSLASNIFNTIGLVLGFSAMTTIITWLQGVLSQFGFAGIVVCFLIVFIFLLKSINMFQDYREKMAGISEKFISLECAARVLKEKWILRDEISSAKTIMQFAADGKIEIRAAKLVNGWAQSENDYASVALIPSDEVSKFHLKKVEDCNSLDCEMHGSLLLENKDGEQYGKVKVSANKLLIVI